MEHDPWVQCPYDKVHMVPKSRIQRHLIKCEKNHPQMSICPYNATHRLKNEEEMKKHVESCPSRPVVLPEDKLPRITGRLTTPREMLKKEYLPETDPNHEIWD